MFQNAKRDVYANKRVSVGGAENDENAVRRGINKPGLDKDGKSTGLATQMSHEWIFTRLRTENLTSSGENLRALLRRRRNDFDLNPSSIQPYQRWISLVTGRQLSNHAKSNGSLHEVQSILDFPDNILQE